jgi:hypothetical protein
VAPKERGVQGTRHSGSGSSRGHFVGGSFFRGRFIRGRFVWGRIVRVPEFLRKILNILTLNKIEEKFTEFFIPFISVFLCIFYTGTNNSLASSLIHFSIYPVSFLLLKGQN